MGIHQKILLVAKRKISFLNIERGLNNDLTFYQMNIKYCKLIFPVR